MSTYVETQRTMNNQMILAKNKSKGVTYYFKTYKTV
jgi:hypothetical protein